MINVHCIISVRIRSYPGPYYPAFGLNTERYQNNSEYGRFSRSGLTLKIADYSHLLLKFLT